MFVHRRSKRRPRAQSGVPLPEALVCIRKRAAFVPIICKMLDLGIEFGSEIFNTRGAGAYLFRPSSYP